MNRAATVGLAAVLAAGFGIGGYYYGKNQPHAQVPDPKRETPGRKVLYWHDPMNPQQRFDKPGRSPFMAMDLVPVYADDKGDGSGVAVSARVRQSLGIRTAAAEVTELRQDMQAVGYVLADERRMARAEVRASGWIEKLHVRAVNEPVRAGQTLAEIYSPELHAAQEEYLLARRMAKENAADEPLARAARRRLQALGVSDSDIGKTETSGEASRRISLLAPISGVVSELTVREGAMVQAGTPAFTLTDLSSVWISVEVPEAQASVLRQGQKADASIQTLPGKTFEGRIDYIYPDLNPQTRTVKARIALVNPGLVLKPGMFAQVSLGAVARKALTVPTEAVIQTGTRSVVIVVDGERFLPATVKTGARTDGHIEILSGLKAGERVVTSGQFLIDSEASLRGALARLEGEAAKGSAEATARHKGRGKITDLHIVKGRIELEHGPIPSLKWPAMTMEFLVADKTVLRTLKRGDAVEFELAAKPTPENDYVIERIERKGAK